MGWRDTCGQVAFSGCAVQIVRSESKAQVHWHWRDSILLIRTHEQGAFPVKPHLPFTLACSFQDAPWHDFGETGKEAVPGQVRGVVVGRLCLACGAHCVFSLVEQYLVGSCWERGLLSRRLRSRLSGPPWKN